MSILTSNYITQDTRFECHTDIYMSILTSDDITQDTEFELETQDIYTYFG